MKIDITSKRIAVAALLAIGVGGISLGADEYVQENGITYRVTRQPTQHLVTDTHLETRESTSYQSKYTTELQATPRTFPVAVTEYHWMPVYRRTWNVFAPPVLTYELVPQTRWETHSDTVQTPVTRTELVPVKVTQQVPVVTQRLVPAENVTKVAVGPAAGAAAANVATYSGATGAIAAPSATVANRSAIGGIYKLDNDPPRSGAAWHPATDADSLRR